MDNNKTKPNTFTVQISFFPSDSADHDPKQRSDVFVTIPLGEPLPHVGDRIVIGDIFYKVIDRSLIISDNVLRDVSWTLLVEQIVNS
jgi:hypothetical protein